MTFYCNTKIHLEVLEEYKLREDDEDDDDPFADMSDEDIFTSSDDSDEI